MRCGWSWFGLVPVALMWGCGGEQAPPAVTSEVGPGAINERLLLAAAKVALPPAGLVPAALPEADSEGAQALVGYCGTCHGIPGPTFHSATDWPSVLRRMWLRMERLPPDLAVPVPDAHERSVLLGYLLDNALPVQRGTLPAGAGRDAFARICSQCHALPDPRAHTATDWPVVFLRMRENMQRMGVAAPDQRETTDVLVYLELVAEAT